MKCGQTITRSTTLTADVGPCEGDGIVIGADNIRLNLNGHTISGTHGPGSGNQAGIRLPFRSGVTVTGHPGRSGKTGTVTGFDAGVVVNGGSGNTIEDLTVRDNIGPDDTVNATLGDGIVLFHSGSNRIINNVVSHNGRFDGIGVLGVDSNDNLIEGNTVEETVGLPPGPGAESSVSGEGTGIIINAFLELDNPRRGESLTNNRVIGNVVRRNDNSGISNISSTDGVIADNEVHDNGRTPDVCNSRIRGQLRCSPAAWPSNGIGLTQGGATTQLSRILVKGNTVTGSAGDGIQVGSRQNRIVENVAVGNGISSAGSRFNRFDLHDLNRFRALCEGVDCPPPTPSCDQNVWHQNVFDTAFPQCAAGTGPEPPPGPPLYPSCTDGIDNDNDGFIDEEDRDCVDLGLNHVPGPPQSGPAG